MKNIITVGYPKSENENNKLKLAQTVTTAALQAGVPYAALEDVTARVEDAFSFKDGKVVARGGYHTVDAFIDSLRVTADHLFEGSPASPATPPATPLSRANMSVDAAAEYIHTHGQAAYFRLDD